MGDVHLGTTQEESMNKLALVLTGTITTALSGATLAAAAVGQGVFGPAAQAVQLILSFIAERVLGLPKSY